jgi:SAM (Sterile alpha motif) domain-containing protein
LDIATWMRGLGVRRYEAAFSDNDVDAEVLPDLTAEDLIGIGVTSVGRGGMPLIGLPPPETACAMR